MLQSRLSSSCLLCARVRAFYSITRERLHKDSVGNLIILGVSNYDFKDINIITCVHALTSIELLTQRSCFFQEPTCVTTLGKHTQFAHIGHTNYAHNHLDPDTHIIWPLCSSRGARVSNSTTTTSTPTIQVMCAMPISTEIYTRRITFNRAGAFACSVSMNISFCGM